MQSLLAAQYKMQEVIDSQCFYDYMTGKILDRRNGRTKEEVVAHIRSFSGPVGITQYSTSAKVVGYTYQPSYFEKRGQEPQIWVNKRIQQGMKVCARASNIAHEISHNKGGYSHVGGKKDQNSVPYSINHAFTRCCVN